MTTSIDLDATKFHSANRAILGMTGFLSATNGLFTGVVFAAFCLALSARQNQRKLALGEITTHARCVLFWFSVGLLIRDWDDAKAGLVQGLIDGGL